MKQAGFEYTIILALVCFSAWAVQSNSSLCILGRSVVALKKYYFLPEFGGLGHALHAKLLQDLLFPSFSQKITTFSTACFDLVCVHFVTHLQSSQNFTMSCFGLETNVPLF